MKYSYKIHQNIYQDAWNWWDACNCITHGVDHSELMIPKVVKAIKGKNQKEAYRFLIPFLREKYLEEKDEIEKSKQNIVRQFNQYFEKACDKIAEVMGKPIYRPDFHFFLTTFGRCPYNKNKGYVWLYVYRTSAIHTFLHELCHFQFIHYWRENPKSPVSKLSDAQFEFLKESLTIILDKNFFPITKKIDKGYDIHRDFRKELKKFWQKDNDFNKLVNFGTYLVTKYT
jgi:hypothetical protein